MSRLPAGVRASLLIDVDAATMVEYALMICMCALIAVAAISTLGVRLGTRFNAAAAAMHPPACDVSNGAANAKNPNC